MVFCEKCGSKVGKNGNFCGNCGFNIKAQTTTAIETNHSNAPNKMNSPTAFLSQLTSKVSLYLYYGLGIVGVFLIGFWSDVREYILLGALLAFITGILLTTENSKFHKVVGGLFILLPLLFLLLYTLSR